jgi:hypothetical protein
LRHASSLLRRIARYTTPGPWRWGDRDVAPGALEQHRSALERAPRHAAFPAIRRLDPGGEAVLPGLRDPLDLVDPLDSIYPHAHGNARWISVLNPSIAESLAALLDSLADSADQTLKAGGSVEHEPYLAAVALAKQIIEAASDWPP